MTSISIASLLKAAAIGRAVGFGCDSTCRPSLMSWCALVGELCRPAVRLVTFHLGSRPETMTKKTGATLIHARVDSFYYSQQRTRRSLA
jgi:hypothetical protein